MAEESIHRSVSLTPRERLVAALVVLACLTWAGFGLDLPFARLVAIAYFLAVPAAVLAGLWTRRRGGISPVRRAVFVSSALGVVLAWIPLAGLAGLIVILSEPWPLSLRQGPDTDHGREVFEQYAGFAPPEGVTELYARTEWAGPGEHVTSIAFRCEDSTVLERIVERLGLVPVPIPEVASLASFDGPSWWPERESLGALARAYRQASGSDPQCFLHLWVDQASGRIYLQDVDVA